MARKTLEQLLGGVKRFGRLTVVEEAEGRQVKATGYMRRMVLVRCDCGETRVVAATELTGGGSRSCGCLAAEMTGARSTKHGQAGRVRTSEYTAWKSAKARCYIPSSSKFPDYGGRGITMCERWRNSFESFFADMGEKPSPEYSIDRIDPNGNYEPGNCQWADKWHQSRNRRTALKIEYRGKTYNCSEAAKIFGIKAHTWAKRIREGWPHALAIETPLQPGRKIATS